MLFYYLGKQNNDTIGYHIELSPDDLTIVNENFNLKIMRNDTKQKWKLFALFIQKFKEMNLVSVKIPLIKYEKMNEVIVQYDIDPIISILKNSRLLEVTPTETVELVNTTEKYR